MIEFLLGVLVAAIVYTAKPILAVSAHTWFHNRWVALKDKTTKKKQ